MTSHEVKTSKREMLTKLNITHWIFKQDIMTAHEAMQMALEKIDTPDLQAIPKVGIISEVLPDNLYEEYINQLNWAPIFMSTDWNDVKQAITGNANAHRQIKMKPLVGNPGEQADLHPHDPFVQAAIAQNFFDEDDDLEAAASESLILPGDIFYPLLSSSYTCFVSMCWRTTCWCFLLLYDLKSETLFV